MAANEEIRLDTSGARRELNQLISKLKQVAKEAGATEEELGGMVDAVDGAGQKAGKGLGGIGGGLGNITKLAKGAGIAMAAAFAVEQIAKFGKFVLDTEKKFTKLRQEIQRFSGLTGTALSEATANVEGLAQTFEKETSEINQAANTLSKQFGIGFNDALGLIEEGFLKGADASGDFLEKVKEYPVQFKNAGFSADEFIKVATQEANAGIFGDKLLDSVKELGLSLRELPKASEDALKGAFGEQFTTQFANQLRTGAVTAKDAIKIIGEQAKKTGLDVKQAQTLTADLFKGAGEDAGGATVVIEQLNKALEMQAGEYDSLGQSQQKALSVQKEFAAEQEKLAKTFEGLGSFLSNLATTITTEVLSAFNDLASATREFFDQDFRINIAVEEGIRGLNLESFEAVNREVIKQKELLKQVQEEEDKLIVQKRIAVLEEKRREIQAKNRAKQEKEQADAAAKRQAEEAAAQAKTTEELKKRIEERRKLNAEIDASAAKLQAEAELIQAGGEQSLERIELLKERALAAFDAEIEAINNRKTGIKLSEEEVSALRLDILTQFEQKRQALLKKGREQEQEDLDRGQAEKLAKIQEAEAENLLVLTELASEGLITQEELQDAQLASTIEFLEQKRELLEASGMSTLELDQALADARLAIKQQENEALASELEAENAAKAQAAEASKALQEANLEAMQAGFETVALFGDALGEEGKELAKFVRFASQVTQQLITLSQASAKSSELVAQAKGKEAIAKSAALQPPFNLIAIASTVSALISGFSTVRNLFGFAEGTPRVTGRGTETSDSIPAFLSVNERVVTAKDNKAYWNVLEMVRSHSMSPKEMETRLRGDIGREGSPVVVINDDNDAIVRAIKNQPQTDITIDEDGFSRRVSRNGSRINYMNLRFR